MDIFTRFFKRFIAFLLLLIVLDVRPQSPISISSSQFKEDTALVNVYFRELKSTKNGSINHKDSILNEIKKIIDRIPECVITVQYYTNKGVYYNYKGDKHSAKKNFEIALGLAEKLKLENNIIRIKTNLAALLLNSQKFSLAQKSYIELLARAKKQGIPSLYFGIYSGLITASIAINEIKIAQTYLSQMQGDCKFSPDTIPYLLLKIKVQYSFEDAELLRKKCIKAKDYTTLLKEYALTIQNLILKKNYSQAEKDALEMLEISKEYGYVVEEGFSNYFLGKIYEETSIYSKALTYLLKYENTNDNFFKYQTNKALSICYAHLNNYKEAYHRLIKYDTLKENSIGLEKQLMISELNIQYNVNEKQEKIDQQELINKLQAQNLQYEKKQKNILIGLVCLISILFFIAIYAFYNQYMIRKKLGESHLEIEQKARELAASNFTKDKLFTIIAHDLRSPINAYQNLGDTVIFLIKKENYQELHLIAKKIDQMGLNLNSLLNNLLDWSLIQQNKLTTEKIKFQLNDLLVEILPIYELLCAQKDIQLIKSVPDSLELYCSKVNLSIIFRNLLDNAIKFSSNSSTISLNVEKIEQQLKIELSNECLMSDSDFAYLKKSLDSNNSRHVKEDSNGLGLELIVQSVTNLAGIIEVNKENNRLIIRVIIDIIGY